VVRLQKTVENYDQALDEPLAVRTYDIERVIFNRPVDSAPPTRQEGDTTVYSLVEEQLVLTKQLVLKEELRVTQRDAERRDTQVVTLRRERFEVERQK
jgi:stress response protein YsnF